jgi:hypothetical protein
LIPAFLFGEKLTDDERIGLLRGLTAEYATVKVLLPRSKKPLPMNSDGSFDKNAWAEASKQLGPAARAGDLVQITHVDIDNDKITFEINGGLKTKKKWYERVEVGMGTRTTPISQNGQPTLGTSLVMNFGKNAVPSDPGEIKKLLKPVLDFEKRSVTEQLIDTFPPEVQQAIKENRAAEGMTRDQVIMALGKPRTKIRETKDGLDTEDWIYGMAPGKITFVTFANGKVTNVKESYAGLGGQTLPPLPPK